MTKPSEGDRDALAFAYLDTLEFAPYPFQEEAILSWFDSEQGVLVCAPTGMGKTVVAEAGLFEALKTGKRAYYTTPLIALTEQKYREIRAKAKAWGFSESDVGLVTGNRRENPDAPILVVVAEILFNRLLSSDIFHVKENGEEETPSARSDANDRFRFDDVAVVVMDEFHQFSDYERGIVWEFTLGLLPAHVRTLLISATVGNAYEFIAWLRNTSNRKLALITSDERKVPLTYQWVGDELLPEFLERMHTGDDDERLVPALVFCFNRDQCWDVAEIIKGKNIIDAERQKLLAAELDRFDWTQGAGPKLRQLLLRGVGVHHAGILPKYRRVVEDLFQRKLLSVAVCTETLAAGINLPARSVVLPTILKGPPGDKKLIDSSTAHQIFGRAGRPQFDDRGFVFALAHPDDVKIARFREKYDSIPEDTKDPKLREAKKKLKKKMPTRNTDEQYWSEAQFQKLREMSPGSLTSRGALPWRLLAHMIEENSDLEPVRRLASRRLMGAKRLAAAQKALDPMLIALWRGGFIRLEPNPADFGIAQTAAAEAAEKKARRENEAREKKERGFGAGLFDDFALDESNDWPDEAQAEASNEAQTETPNETRGDSAKEPANGTVNISAGQTESAEPVVYRAERAFGTEKLAILTHLRGVNPLYGAFLLEHLGLADRTERILAFESLLEMPSSLAHSVRVPNQDQLPSGPLARERLDPLLLELGLATVEELVPKTEEEREKEREERKRFGGYLEERVFVLSLAEKLRRLFDWEYPTVPVKTVPVWSAGEILLQFNGDFNKYITSNRLQKQEGVVFRHLLRLILLLEEFRPLTPTDTLQTEWEQDLTQIGEMLTDSCRKVDPMSTEETLLTAKNRENE